MKKDEIKLLREINNGIKLNNKILAMQLEMESDYMKAKTFDSKALIDIEFDRKMAASSAKKAGLFKDIYDYQKGTRN